MTSLTTADVWLILAAGWSVVAGFALHEAYRNWRDTRRATRRLAAAEAAFWASLQGVVDRAMADIDEGADFTVWEAEVSP